MDLFNSQDIVVADGIIAKYAVIKMLVKPAALIRKANTDEIDRYNNRP